MSRPARISHLRVARLAAGGLACILLVGQAETDPPVTSPLGSSDSVTLEPVPAEASPRRRREVFVCQDGGVPVFSDRPCGSAAAPRALVVEAPRPGAPATTIPPAPRASTRPQLDHRHEAAPGRIAENRCTTLQRQLDELNDRMRAGYSAREAARLWQRWRDVKERLRSARC
jgi:hypothetical protein